MPSRAAFTASGGRSTRRVARQFGRASTWTFMGIKVVSGWRRRSRGAKLLNCSGKFAIHKYYSLHHPAANLFHVLERPDQGQAQAGAVEAMAGHVSHILGGDGHEPLLDVDGVEDLAVAE